MMIEACLASSARCFDTARRNSRANSKARIDTETQSRIAGMTETLRALEPGWQELLENSAAYIMEAAGIRHAIRTITQSGINPEQPGLRFS